MTPEVAQISDEPQVGDISREEIVRRLNDPKLTIVDVLPHE